MDRLEQLRQMIDETVRKNLDPEESRCGFVHLYGVSAICTILALKRDLDPELCSTAGMLHDIWNYKYEDCPEHDRLGAEEARQTLVALGRYTAEEIDLICTAISTHGDKLTEYGEMAELLKDADVFQHYIYNPQMFEGSYSEPTIEPSPARLARLRRIERVLAELGIDLKLIRM